jgi:competence protein ComEC
MTAAPRLPLPTNVADSPLSVDSRFYLAPVAGAGWLVGIGLAAPAGLGLGFWLAMAAVGVIGAVALWRVGRVGLALAGVAALALGGARAAAAVPTIDAGHVAAYNGAAEIVLRGEVAAEPDVSDTSRRLTLAARELVSDGQTHPVSGLVQVELPRYPAVGYGAALSLSGELSPLASLNSPDYAAYLTRQGIFSVMRFPQVSVLGEAGGSAWRRALLAVRERGRAAIRAGLPEPQAALLTGILLGDDSGLPRALSDDFQTTGMTHIIAISGFNIALIIALLDRLAAPLLPRRLGAVVIATLIVLYALLVGASASVVRAAIMGISYLVGLRLMGRPTLALAGLFSAAFLMTLWNPLTLWSVGFQLSLTATLGLLLFGEPWTRRLRRGAAGLPPAVRRPTTQLLGEGLIITLAAQVLTVPLLVYHFGTLSLASLPANFLVLPAQPAVMLTGGLTLLAGLAWPAAGRLVGLPAWLFLTYTIRVIEWLARVPGASQPLRLPAEGLLAVYAVIAAVTLVAAAGQPRRRAAAERLRSHPWRNAALGGLAVVALLAGAWWLQRPDGRLHVAFLDVGQGDATLIQSPDGRQVLIDGGRYPSVVLARLGEQMPFWDHSLDLVIATHPDDDHAAGLVAVVDGYDVAGVMTNGAAAGDDAGYAALLTAAEATGAPILVAQPGQSIDLGDGARLDILSAGGEAGTADNDASVVARLTYGDLSVLLTGDAGEAAEAALLAGGGLAPTVVLKAGHHGANTSSGEAFLAALRPQFIVISAGADNSYGHPAPAMLARAAAAGAVVLRTDEMGTIEVSSDGGRMWWEVERR